MKKIIIDTNILLDVFGQRQPHYDNSVQVWSLAETEKVQGFISAISYNNIFYILQKVSGLAAARKALVLLRDTFTTIDLDQKLINMAIDSKFKDFEDAIHYFSAIRTQADCIITRNQKDFKLADIPVYSPEEFLQLV